MKTIFVKPLEADRKWYIIDAKDQVMGQVAVKVADVLRGKNKASFARHHELGDFVVVINADKVALSGNKRNAKMYYRHSGFPGGLYAENFEKLIARKPTAPLEKAIKGMLPKGPLGRKLFKNVKIYSGEKHPHASQKPQALEL